MAPMDQHRPEGELPRFPTSEEQLLADRIVRGIEAKSDKTATDLWVLLHLTIEDASEHYDLEPNPLKAVGAFMAYLDERYRGVMTPLVKDAYWDCIDELTDYMPFARDDEQPMEEDEAEDEDGEEELDPEEERQLRMEAKMLRISFEELRAMLKQLEEGDDDDDYDDDDECDEEYDPEEDEEEPVFRTAEEDDEEDDRPKWSPEWN